MKTLPIHTEDDFSTAHGMSKEKAEEVAQAVQADDPEWTYDVVTDPGTQLSYVRCCDENGDFLGWF